MTIKLYGGYSAVSQHVSIVLREKGVSYEFHKLSVRGGDLKKPEYMAMQPFGQMPCLVSASRECSSGSDARNPRNGVTLHSIEHSLTWFFQG
jgi:glutathione S-transferase